MKPDTLSLIEDQESELCISRIIIARMATLGVNLRASAFPDSLQKRLRLPPLHQISPLQLLVYQSARETRPASPPVVFR